MKNFWKWVLGIVVVLVVLFALGVGARLLMARLLPDVSSTFDGHGFPMMGGRPFGHGGMRMFSMGGFGMFGGLLPLLLIGLLAYGAYWFGKRNRSTVQVPPAASLKTCSNCGASIQAGWNNCPNCGTKVE